MAIPSIKMTNKARKAAGSLAIAYDAYLDASRNDDENGIVVWGLKLDIAQQQTGIVLITNIRGLIR